MNQSSPRECTEPRTRPGSEKPGTRSRAYTVRHEIFVRVTELVKASGMYTIEKQIRRRA